MADCKLATEENLRKIAAWHGLFVSVMPRTWSEDPQFREKVKRKEINWKHILSRKNNRKPDSKRDRYYVAEGDYKTSHGYRLHWIRSTQKAEQDAAARGWQLERALEDLRSIQTKLNTYHEIAPMYLKKDERVVAYLHMHVMALMVAALIERTLRRAMQRKKLANRQ